MVAVLANTESQSLRFDCGIEANQILSLDVFGVAAFFKVIGIPVNARNNFPVGRKNFIF